MCKLYLLTFCLMLSGEAFCQCSNSIELSKVSSDKEIQNSGIIEISVSTPHDYVCILNIEKGSGPEKIQEKEGSGKAIVRFESLDKNAIYQVQVEFVGEKNNWCNKLQKSQITFEQ